MSLLILHRLIGWNDVALRCGYGSAIYERKTRAHVGLHHLDAMLEAFDTGVSRQYQFDFFFVTACMHASLI